MPSHDFAQQLADAPRLVIQREAQNVEAVSRPSPQQPASRPDAQPVLLTWRHALSEQAMRGRATEHQDELTLNASAAEQGQTSVDNM